MENLLQALNGQSWSKDHGSLRLGFFAPPSHDCLIPFGLPVVPVSQADCCYMLITVLYYIWLVCWERVSLQGEVQSRTTWAPFSCASRGISPFYDVDIECLFCSFLQAPARPSSCPAPAIHNIRNSWLLAPWLAKTICGPVGSGLSSELVPIWDWSDTLRPHSDGRGRQILCSMRHNQLQYQYSLTSIPFSNLSALFSDRHFRPVFFIFLQTSLSAVAWFESIYKYPSFGEISFREN